MDKLANTVIKKIKSETEKLSTANGDLKNMHDAISRIHLLSELWLESYEEKPANNQTAHVNIQPSELLENEANNMTVNKEDTSIFDF